MTTVRNKKNNPQRYALTAPVASLLLSLAAPQARADFLGLGDLAGGIYRSEASGVSGDGSVVVGYSNSANGHEAFRWTEAGGMVGLGDLAGGVFTSRALGVNSDGSVVVGYSNSANGHEAFRWTQSGGMVGLGDLAGGVFTSRALGVNSDGSVVVGFGTSASGYEAFRWTQAGGMVGLGDLAGGTFESWAYAVSGDGSVVVGDSLSASGYEAFRWTEAGGMVGLGDLPGGFFSSTAYGVNRDGSVVVGYGASASGGEAFRWTEATGMQTVTEWLAASGVSVGSGLTLVSANGVSDDGSVVVGSGINGDRKNEAWVARATAGVLFLDGNLTQSLASSGLGLEQVTQHVDLMLNGAHHRPLMDSAMPGNGSCAWVSGDLANYNHDRNGNSALGEVGFCNRLQGNELMFGIGLGMTRSDEDTDFSGNSEVDGKYLLGELDYRPTGSPLLYSLTAVIGSWDADVERGYMNGVVEDSSTGHPDLESAALRARVDWLDAWQLGKAAFTPHVQFGVTHTRMGGYTETGGGFPVHFNKREHTAQELRLGVSGDHALNSATSLRGDVEAVHRFDQSSANTSGQIIGLFGFDLPGSDVKQNWMRVGLELDHRLSKDKTVSASVHASSAGEDPSYSAGVVLKVGL